MVNPSTEYLFKSFIQDVLNEHGPEQGARIIELATARLADAGGGSLRQWVEAVRMAELTVKGNSKRLN